MVQAEWFLEIVQSVIEPTIIYRDGYVWYDMVTQAKSHLWIRLLDDRSYMINTRYNGSQTLLIDDVRDILQLVKECMYGREHVSATWADLMVKHGLAKIVTTTRYVF